MGYLSKSTASNLPGRGLINPAFVIRIVPATDAMQQPQSQGRDNPTNDYLDNVTVGTQVKTKTTNGVITGKIERIIKNELGDGVYAIVRDAKGKSYKVEGSRLEILGSPSQDDFIARNTSSPAMFAESKILSFNKFINE